MPRVMSLSLKSLPESILNDESNWVHDQCLLKLKIVTPLQELIRAFLLRHRKIALRFHPIVLPVFRNLQQLDFSYTRVRDSCLLILGAFCRDLRYLALENCPVTDAGIKGLCVSVDNLGIERARAGKCKSIHTLKVRHTKVTKIGIQIAFENLPDLKIFDFCYSVLVLAELHQTALDELQPWDILQYSLPYLEYGPCDFGFCRYPRRYKSGYLKLASYMCFSSITKVKITLQKLITDSELLGLLALQNLCDLEISGFANGVKSITFHGGIAPLLKTFGKSLNSLSFSHLDIDLGVVIGYCQNLSILNLFNCTFKAIPENEHQPIGDVHMIKARPILEKLTSLSVSCNAENSLSFIPPENLSSLLSSTVLVKLYILQCDTLTDGLLLDAAKLHCFPNLEKLDLRGCNQVSKKGIDVFMNSDNPLKEINLERCSLLTPKDRDEWERLAKENNWQVKLSIFWDMSRSLHFVSVY